MKYVSVSDARRNLSKLVDEVERTIVVRNNKPVAAIVQMDDFEALLACQARLRDPRAYVELIQAHRDVVQKRPGSRIDISDASAEEILEMAAEAVEADADANASASYSRTTPDR